MAFRWYSYLRSFPLLALLLTISCAPTGTPDTNPPSVALVVSPESPIAVAGTLTITAAATDDIGIAKVEFFRERLGPASVALPHRSGAVRDSRSARTSLAASRAMVEGSSAPTGKPTDRAVTPNQEPIKIGEATEPPYRLRLEIGVADNGTHRFTATATDAAGNTASDSATITIAIPTPNNEPPRFVTVPTDQNVLRNTLTPAAVSVSFEVSDPDGDPLTVTASSDNRSVVAASDLDPVCDAGNCTLEFTPSPAATANATISLRAEDDQGAAATASFVVRVRPRLVTSDADAGPGTLRQTLTEAVAGDVIGFDTAGLFGEPQAIVLGSSLVLDDSVSIEGTGVASLVLSGNDADRIFSVSPTADANLSDLTLAGGRAPSDCGTSNDRSCGGGIRVAVGGNLTLSGVQLTGNVAADDGGAIYNEGSLLLDGVSMNDNRAGGLGGAIYNVGSATISGSRLRDNRGTGGGGALFNSGVLRLDGGSLVAGNSATAAGGGVANDGGSIALVDSTLRDNHSSSGSGGAVFTTAGSVSLDNANLIGNSAAVSGGGVYAVQATVTVENTVVTGNHAASSGGGIYTDGGDVALTGSIVRNNTAGVNGGGIYATGDLSIANSTIGDTALETGNKANDSGGGIYLASSANATVSADTSITFNQADADNDSFGQGGGIFDLGNLDNNGTVSNNQPDDIAP